MKKFVSFLMVLAMVFSCALAIAEEPAAEPQYELIYIDNFDSYADNTEWATAWTPANVGPEALGSTAELVEIAGYAEEGKSVKWILTPEKAEWWAPKLQKKGSFPIQGDGITFWVRNDEPMQLRIEFMTDDWMYQCIWDMVTEDMQPGVHQFFFKWEDLLIKEAGIELEKGELNFKDEVKGIGEFMFFGYGPDSHKQANWVGECYIDSVAFFTVVSE